ESFFRHDDERRKRASAGALAISTVTVKHHHRFCCGFVANRAASASATKGYVYCGHKTSSFLRAMWFVVPDPPLVRRGLWITLRRVLPLLLAPERSDIEVVPGIPHLLVAAVVDEVGAEHAVAVADERVRAVPLVHAEVGVEVVRDGVPGHLPAHPRLHSLDVRLRRPRDERERSVT